MKVFLIHNLSRRFDAINFIKNGFSAEINIEEVFSQKNHRISISQYLNTKICTLLIELNIIQPTVNIREILFIVKFSVYEIVKMFLCMASKQRREKVLKRGWIVYSISSKHIRAWKRFALGNDSIAYIFEDDVISDDNTGPRNDELIDFLLKNNFNGYLDIAGGYDLSSTHKASNLIFNSGFGFGIYRVKPRRSNTACGYVLSKEMAKIFLQIIADNKKIRLMPIDFIINYCLNHRAALSLHCSHVEPPIFYHGSFIGRYSTWDF